jgi:GTPase SAR1 family protein
VCGLLVNTMDVRFKTPANFYICGQSQSGKSYLVRSMLRNLEELFFPIPSKVLYCYGEFQKEFDRVESF